MIRFMLALSKINVTSIVHGNRFVLTMNTYKRVGFLNSPNSNPALIHEPEVNMR